MSPIGPIGDQAKPQVSGVISRMLGKSRVPFQPEDEGLTQTLPGTFERAEFGATHYDPASARQLPIPVQHLMTPAQRARTFAPGAGEIGGGIEGSVNGAQPGMPASPTGPSAPGTGGLPLTAGGGSAGAGAGAGVGGGDRGVGGTGGAGGTGGGGTGGAAGGAAGAGAGAQAGGDWGGMHGEDPGAGWGDRNRQGMARGGIVNRPTRAVIGEAGPEAAVPVTDPSQARRLANEIARANLKKGNYKDALAALKRVQAGEDGGDGDEPGNPYWHQSPRRKREV